MFWNGRTAMEGLSGSGGTALSLSVSAPCAPGRTVYARTGLEIFLSCCSPRSSKPTSSEAAPQTDEMYSGSGDGDRLTD
jgi:hypothetical protein